MAARRVAIVGAGSAGMAMYQQMRELGGPGKWLRLP